MEGSDAKVVEKAVRRAVAKHFSQLKKARKPGAVLKAKAENLLVTVHSRLWKPSDKTWWDAECEARFEDIQLLAAMVSINLLKAPQNFGQMFPEECKKYFDFLAKKRFATADPEAVKAEVKEAKAKSKTALERRFEERKAGEVGKTEKQVLGEVIVEMAEKERIQAVTNVKREWKPSGKPWFNDECATSFSALASLASEQGCDLEARAADYKKFKLKNKEVCKTHFALLEETRKAFNLKKDEKEERKKVAEEKKKEKEAEGTAGATESEEGKVKEKGTVDFSEEDENMNDGPPVKKSKKSKKKH